MAVYTYSCCAATLSSVTRKANWERGENSYHHLSVPPSPHSLQPFQCCMCAEEQKCPIKPASFTVWLLPSEGRPLGLFNLLPLIKIAINFDHLHGFSRVPIGKYSSHSSTLALKKKQSSHDSAAVTHKLQCLPCVFIAALHPFVSRPSLVINYCCVITFTWWDTQVR